ncbi:unnamed protein product [marine sediment metagenome]|uniref:Uncharacterized protein n=1 Tax=marine sediment metagenome TaxID=412755 RepID=X0TN30_9ZZZZ
MSKIEELELKLTILTNEFAEYREQEAKVEREVKPVFPKSDAWIVDIDCVRGDCGQTLVSRAAEVGCSFYSYDEADQAVARDVARAYVIERINEANKGDNGFKVGEDNYFYEYSYESNSIDYGLSCDLQRLESDLYCRNLSLLDCKVFRDAYKTMLKIK